MAYLNDTLTLVLENYGVISLSNSTRWGLIDRTRQLSRMLFGSYMNEDVLYLSGYLLLLF